MRFVETGKLRFGDLVRGILADLARLAIRQAIVGPLSRALAGAFGGGTGDAPTVVAGQQHGGGVAGRPAVTRRAPARIFAGAARLHRGGVAGLGADEVPAILRRGEGVFTPEQMRALAPAAAPRIAVEVRNESARPVRARRASARFDGSRLVVDRRPRRSRRERPDLAGARRRIRVGQERGVTSSWPDYAEVAADGYALGAAPGVSRTEWDDGAVRQARTRTRALLEREATALLRDGGGRTAHQRLAAFRAWAAAHAHAWFRWTEPEDGVVRLARVRGGRGRHPLPGRGARGPPALGGADDDRGPSRGRGVTSARYRRAARELAPEDILHTALEIAHPSIPTPVRVVADAANR